MGRCNRSQAAALGLYEKELETAEADASKKGPIQLKEAHQAPRRLPL